jgi:hypothetical protein
LGKRVRTGEHKIAVAAGEDIQRGLAPRRQIMRGPELADRAQNREIVTRRIDRGESGAQRVFKFQAILENWWFTGWPLLSIVGSLAARSLANTTQSSPFAAA